MLNWFYPGDIHEALRLNANASYKIHGGGTFLLRSDLNKYEAIVDISALGLDYVLKVNEMTEIGAMATFTDILCELPKDHILYKALAGAAATPIRNRVTVGGSIAAFPIWSDLVGPLMALESELVLLYENGDVVEELTVPIADYYSDLSLKNNSLIKSVRFCENSSSAYYHRSSRTKFDYRNN